MQVQRPGAVTAASVLAIIYGSLFTLCGLCGVAGLAMQGAGNPFVGNDPVQGQLQKQLEGALLRDVPAYQLVQIVGVFLGLAVAVTMLVGGIAILSMRPGARTALKVACVIAILLSIFQAVYQAAFVMPAMNRAFQVAIPEAVNQDGQPPPPQMAQAMQAMQAIMTITAIVTVVIYGLFIIYVVIILVLLSQAHVNAAFAGVGKPGFDDDRADPHRERRDYDDDQDWSQEPPGQSRGNPDDDWRIRPK